MSGEGDCFQVAGSIVTDCLIFGRDTLDNPKLIHATITGQGPIEGLLHDHAWVEYDAKLGEHSIRMALDRSNGKNLELPAELYRAYARIAQGTIREYSPEETRILILRHMHWGPWEEEHGRSKRDSKRKRPKQKANKEKGCRRNEEPHSDDAGADG